MRCGPSWRRSSTSVTVACAVAHLLTITVSAQANAAPGRGSEPDGEAPAATSQAQRMAVGIFVVGIDELYLKSGTYLGDFYLWFHWEGDYGPEEFEVMNGRETVKERVYPPDAQGTTYQLVNGVKYAVYRVQTRLHRSFDFRGYPLDQHTLTIEVEDGAHNTRELRYAVDSRNPSGIQPGIQLMGWEVGKLETHVKSWLYPTNYGDPALPPTYQERYSRYVAEIPIRHAGFGIFFKVFLPLFISVAIGFLAVFVAPDALEVRVGLGVAAVFGAVSNLLVVAGNLPETPQFTLSDNLHLSGLFFIFLSLVISCIAYWFVQREREKTAVRLDHWSRVLLPGIYTFLVICFTAFR